MPTSVGARMLTQRLVTCPTHGRLLESGPVALERVDLSASQRQELTLRRFFTKLLEHQRNHLVDRAHLLMSGLRIVDGD